MVARKRLRAFIIHYLTISLEEFFFEAYENLIIVLFGGQKSLNRENDLN